MRVSRVPQVLVRVVCACGIIAVAGCGDGPKVVPVSGTATLDGKSLGGFMVTFIPDEANGNVAQVDCSAVLAADGKYSVTTDDRYDQYQGVPPGWYKVTIWSQDDQKIPVHKKYQGFTTTPLSIEVVADPAPGAYDLKFTK